VASPNDLTDLSTVKTWLGITSTADDATLSSLITSMSGKILALLGRQSILPATYNEVRDAIQYHQGLLLRRWPVISVMSVSIDGAVALPATTPGTSGWSLEQVDPYPPGRPTFLYIGCHPSFYRHGITISYTAGYQISGEQWVVPATPFQITVTQPNGRWASDVYVAYASGAALTKVASAPAVGQYSVAAGVYTFNAADAGASVAISYGYVPAALAEACTELVADRYNYRTNKGYQSKSLGGQETVTFASNTVSSFIRETLELFRATVTP